VNNPTLLSFTVADMQPRVSPLTVYDLLPSESPAARNAGLVIGVDLKTFEGIENVHRIVGDFTDLKVQHQIFRVMTEVLYICKM